MLPIFGIEALVLLSALGIVWWLPLRRPVTSGPTRLRLPTVPQANRRQVACGIATFGPGITATSFVLALGPSLLSHLLDVHSPLLAGGMACAMFLTATGEQFSKEYVTDDNGEIHIEGLRVGDYVISEVSNDASAKYVLPDKIAVTVLEGKTTVAKFYNALKPVTPDVPKTGDTTNIALWAALCGLSLAGAGAAAFFGFRRKKSHESEDK